jgi:hypothetical protein
VARPVVPLVDGAPLGSSRDVLTDVSVIQVVRPST